MPPLGPVRRGVCPAARLDVGGDGLHLVQQAGLGMFPGVLIEEAVNVGEEHQEVGPHQVADQGGQVVVVPELQLVRGHGVVFVDDGHHLPAQQGEEGVPGVQEAGPGFQVVVGQEDLGHLEADLGKGQLVGVHHDALAGGGHGLGLGDARGTGFKPQLAAARGDGPGRNQDKLPVPGAQAADLPHQALDEGLVEAVGPGQDRAAQLEDDPLGFTQVVLS